MPIRRCTVRDLRIDLELDSEEEGGQVRNYELWRAGHYDSKEPDTLDWIDTHFSPGEVMFDVGANIGQYSLYGRGASAEEPASSPSSRRPSASPS